jgi:hypothetical protein
MTTYELELESEQVDCSAATIKDVSDYQGELRTDKANLLVIAKMSSSGVPTYLSGIDNTSPLSAIVWNFPTATDGWYRFNLIRLSLYSASPVNTLAEVKDGNGVITQFATVLYHTPTSQVVKAKTTGSISVQPGAVGWQTYWEVITDLSVLVSYGTIEVLVDGQLIDCYHRDRLRDQLDAINSKPWFSDGKERAKLYEKYLQFDSDLNGLQALNSEGRFAEMEEACRQMEEIYL